VHVGSARLKTFAFSVAARAGYSCGLALVLFLVGSKGLQNAVAEGDTRTISMHHIHTDEDITITFKRDGRYDEAALEKLNWFLRDWRRGEQTKMDPHLIDLIWEVQRETGSKEPVWVVCGYRSPQTNAMLRHRSSGVARFSQHMLGHAMDFYIPGVPLEQLRAMGLRLQRGGVGFYPESGSPFVHMDTGGIRMWPRMTRQELVRVFPDGRTVHIPTDGRPLPGYAIALADIRKRGDTIPSANSLEAARDAGVNVGDVVASNERHHANPFAKLLGLAKDDEDEDSDSTARAATASANPAPAATVRSHIKQTVVAALERGVDKVEKIEKKVAAKAGATLAAAAAIPPKLIHTAALAPVPAPQAAASDAPALTPNQVISARGYWRGLPDGVNAAQPTVQSANPLRSIPRPRGTEVASADPGATGTVIAVLGANNPDRVPAQLALAYAEPPAPQASSPAAPMGATVARAPAGQSGTTIAVKRTLEQASSTVMTAGMLSSVAIKVGAHFDNPWVRAIILSPSVHRFLTTLALGARDFRSLATLMLKPASAVMMTFSAEPNPGLEHDHFSGSAIVFVSTVTYPTHTASLH
jgi:uncharacterized protein YcbK (DUF882 family)